jgi:uncharacterized protein YuzE
MKNNNEQKMNANFKHREMNFSGAKYCYLGLIVLFLSLGCNYDVIEKSEFTLLQPEYRNDSIILKWKYRNYLYPDNIGIDLFWDDDNNHNGCFSNFLSNLSPDEENIITTPIDATGFPWIDTLYFWGQAYNGENYTVMTSNIVTFPFDCKNKSFYQGTMRNYLLSKADKKLYYFKTKKDWEIVDLNKLEIVSSNQMLDGNDNISSSCSEYFFVSNNGEVEIYFLNEGRSFHIYDVNTLEKKAAFELPFSFCYSKFISNNRGMIYAADIHNNICLFDRFNLQFLQYPVSIMRKGTQGNVYVEMMSGHVYYNEADNELYATEWNGIVKIDLDEEGKITGVNTVKSSNLNINNLIYINNSSWFIILQNDAYIAFNAETQEQIEITLPIPVQAPNTFFEYNQILYKNDNLVYLTNKHENQTKTKIYCLSIPDFSVVKTIDTWVEYKRELWVDDDYLYVIGSQIDKIKL